MEGAGLIDLRVVEGLEDVVGGMTGGEDEVVVEWSIIARRRNHGLESKVCRSTSTTRTTHDLSHPPLSPSPVLRANMRMVPLLYPHTQAVAELGATRNILGKDSISPSLTSILKSSPTSIPALLLTSA